MGSKPRTPMPVSERAKQFMPFAAVKGLEEAIRAKEEEMEREVEQGASESSFVGRPKMHDTRQ